MERFTDRLREYWESVCKCNPVRFLYLAMRPVCPVFMRDFNGELRARPYWIHERVQPTWPAICITTVDNRVINNFLLVLAWGVCSFSIFVPFFAGCFRLTHLFHIHLPLVGFSLRSKWSMFEIWFYNIKIWCPPHSLRLAACVGVSSMSARKVVYASIHATIRSSMHIDGRLH